MVRTGIIRDLWRSFTARLLAGTLVIQMLLAGVLYTGLIRGVERYQTSQFIEYARSYSYRLATLVSAETDRAHVVPLLHDVILSGEVAYAQFKPLDGEIVAASQPGLPAMPLREDFFFGEHGDHFYFLSVTVHRDDGQRLGILRLGFDEMPVEEQLTAWRRYGAIAVGLYVLLLSGFITASGVLLTRSIRRLRDLARRIANGETGECIAIDTPVAEVVDLARDLDVMRVELVRRQGEIMAGETHARAVLETVAEGILTLDDQGRIQTFNRAAQSIFGRAALQAENGRFADLFVLADSQAMLPETGRPELCVGIELTACDALGATFPVRVSITAAEVEGRRFYTVTVEDVREQSALRERLTHQASHDALTGLPNRVLLHDRLNLALAQADRLGCMVALLFIDLDRFKYVNDVLGHATGDALLRAVAERLRACVRDEDTLARLGGDEFTVVLPNLDEIAQAGMAAEMILRALDRPVEIDGREFFVSGSIGVSLYPRDGAQASEIMKHADTAMYSAKAGGGGRHVYYQSDNHSAAHRHLEFDAEIRRGMARGEFLLHYQPQFEIATGRVIGMEALLRWQHPVRGLLSPDAFLGVLEETGLIVPLGEWVLQTACAQGRSWHDAGLSDLRIGANLSATQFARSDVNRIIEQALSRTGFDPRCLEIELTEHVVMRNIDAAVHVLHAFSERGVRVALDDFGSGYSSLGYLRRLPINMLKVGGTFVRDVMVNADDAAIVAAIIVMGHRLGLDVIVEGVETREQFEFLRTQRCDLVQGYYFSRPLDVTVATTFLQTARTKTIL